MTREQILVSIKNLRKKGDTKYKKHIVKEDHEDTILTRRGVIMYKNNIKNYTIKSENVGSSRKQC